MPSLIVIANTYYLSSNGQTGPALKFQGSPVVVGQFSPWWTPIGSMMTASGYEVAWKYSQSDLYGIWQLDSTGEYTSYDIFAGDDYHLQVRETGFQQDINGDGQIGPITSVIELYGATSLTAVADEYFLYDTNKAGPALKYKGADIVVGQFGATWQLIGAEKSTAGYDVAWKHLGSDLYSIWATDSSGNFLSYAHYSGDDYALQSIEGGFHQDLNSDGQIGLFSTVIESAGVTRLTGVVDEYYLFDSNGTGPALRFNDENVAVGAFGPSWSPIGAEITSAGYQVAWKFSGTDLYSIWNTDALGNVAAYKHYSGAAYGLQALEASFRQDLNSDGTTGAVTRVIETAGASFLTQVADRYYIFDAAGAGPTLNCYDSPVFDGEFTPWAPIAAEATGSGYLVAWKYGVTDLYSIWNTDRGGDVTSYVHNSGSDSALKALETAFAQDINGDAIIGL